MRYLFLISFIFLALQGQLFAQEEEEADTIAIEAEPTVEFDSVAKVSSFKDIKTFKMQDSTHSPRLAALYSAVIPGLGQFYNEKYWKIPLIYAMGAFAAYQIKRNHQSFLYYRNANIALRDLDPSNDQEAQGLIDRGQNLQSIERRVERFDRDKQYWIILAGLFYVLNIVDATVDAHLREFNINPDLSLNIEPTINRTQFNNFQAGVTFNFRLK